MATTCVLYLVAAVACAQLAGPPDQLGQETELSGVAGAETETVEEKLPTPVSKSELREAVVTESLNETNPLGTLDRSQVDTRILPAESLDGQPLLVPQAPCGPLSADEHDLASFRAHAIIQAPAAPVPISAETTLGEDAFLDPRTGNAVLHVDVPYDADLFVEYVPESGSPGMVSQPKNYELRSRGGHRHLLLHDLPMQGRTRVRVTARLLRDDMEKTLPQRTQYVRLMAGDRKQVTFHANDFVIAEDWRLYAPIEYVAADDNVRPAAEVVDELPTASLGVAAAPQDAVIPEAADLSLDAQSDVEAQPVVVPLEDAEPPTTAAGGNQNATKEVVPRVGGKDIRMSVAIPVEDLSTKPLSVRGEYKLDVFPYSESETE